MLVAWVGKCKTKAFVRGAHEKVVVELVLLLCSVKLGMSTMFPKWMVDEWLDLLFRLVRTVNDKESAVNVAALMRMAAENMQSMETGEVGENVNGQ